MPVNAAEIVVRFKDEFSTTAAKAQKEFAKIGESAKLVLGLAGAATTLGATLAATAKQAADYGDEINDMRQKTGLAAEQLSVLSYAARQSGSSFEGAATGLKQLSKSAYEAVSGGKEQLAVFRQLGVAVADTTGHVRPLNDLLLDLADSFSNMSDNGAEKAALAMKVFGKSGSDMIPLLNEGRAGMSKFADEASRFGLVINNEAAKASDEFNDALGRLKASFDGLVIKIGMRVIPFITPAVDAASNAVGNLHAPTAPIGGMGLGFSSWIASMVGKGAAPGTNAAAPGGGTSSPGLPFGPFLTPEELKELEELVKRRDEAVLEFQSIVRSLSGTGFEPPQSFIQRKAGEFRGFGLSSNPGVNPSPTPITDWRAGIPSPAFGVNTLTSGLNAVQGFIGRENEMQAVIIASDFKFSQRARDKAAAEISNIGKSIQRGAGSIWDAIFSKGGGGGLVGLDAGGREHDLKDQHWMDEASRRGWQIFYKEGESTLERLGNVFVGWLNSLGRSMLQKGVGLLSNFALTGSARGQGAGGLVGALPGLAKIPGIGRAFGALSQGLGLGAAVGGSALSAGSAAAPALFAGNAEMLGLFGGTAAGGGIGAGAGAGTGAAVGLSGAATFGIAAAVAGAVFLGFKLFSHRTHEAGYTRDPFSDTPRTIEFYAANQTRLAHAIETLARKINVTSVRSVITTGFPDALQADNQFRRRMGGVLMDDDL
jgi:hypothetical protein